MRTQISKISRCISMINEIRDFFNDATIDSYLIGAEEGLHLAKVEIINKMKASATLQSIE